jgi:hypothetical protein
MTISNLGHGVRMDGRRHRHDHCLHYGRLLFGYVVSKWCQQVGSMVFARVDKFPFIEEWSSHV